MLLSPPPFVKMRVFVTTSTDNIDIGLRFEVQGTLFTITAHPTKGNPGIDPTPLNHRLLQKLLT